MDIVLEIFKGIASIFLYFWWLFAILLLVFAWQNRRKAKWASDQENLILEIKIPKTNDKTPTASEMMFATLHGILKPKTELVKEGQIQEHLSFEFVSDNTSIRFFVWTPKHLKDFVEGQIYAQYPSAEITETNDYSREDLGTCHVNGAEVVLERDDFLPIKTFNNFQVDPLAGITGVLSKLDETNEKIWIQILARPVSDEWKRGGLNWIAKKKGGSSWPTDNFGSWLFKGFIGTIGELISAIVSGPADAAKATEKKMSTEDESRVSAIEQKSEKLGYEVKIRVIYLSETNAKTAERIQAVFGAFKQYNTTNLNGFKGKNIHNDHEFLRDYQNRLFLDSGFHLNIEELASIYHLPHTSVETPNINWTTSKTGEPPTTLPNLKNTEPSDITLFAETNFRSNRETFGIKRDDRRRHTYIIGKSGMGKTKLLENMIMDDIQKGEGVAVIDPHGDLIMETLKKIPEERVKDVIIFDPADLNFPIAYNPMEVIDENLKNNIAAGVLGTFKKIFGTSWGPRLEYIFNYTLLALLDTPDTTLIGVVTMLTDKEYRKKIVGNIKDAVVKKFWTTEYAAYNEKWATEAIAPILNKVGQFVANSLIRNIIGQPRSSFNIRKAMDEGKILLINLSTGRTGETNAALLGAMMITSIQLAAMSRADTEESKRRDFYLYVDEFQNFATESFANILSEARKYHLNLTMANQYIAQMEESGVKDAIFGNVGTIITFRVGASDANELVKEFSPPFEAQDLINLARQQVYIRMTIDGQSEPAFSAKTLTVTNDTTGQLENIVRHSHEEYTKPLAEVEEVIARSAGIEVITTKDQMGGTDTVIVPKGQVEEAVVVSANDNLFEAPIVKRISSKKKKEDLKEKLKEVIRENTAHLDKKEKENIVQQETKAPLSQVGESDTKAMKVKDKIDKEILSEILKAVVTPTAEPETENKLNNNERPVENKSADREVTEKKEPEITVEKSNMTGSPVHQKKEKLITAENFKEIKAIHPHEVIKIVPKNDKNLHSLSEGEEVKFD